MRRQYKIYLFSDTLMVCRPNTLGSGYTKKLLLSLDEISVVSSHDPVENELALRSDTLRSDVTRSDTLPTPSRVPPGLPPIAGSNRASMPEKSEAADEPDESYVSAVSDISSSEAQGAGRAMSVLYDELGGNEIQRSAGFERGSKGGSGSDEGELLAPKAAARQQVQLSASGGDVPGGKKPEAAKKRRSVIDALTRSKSDKAVGAAAGGKEEKPEVFRLVVTATSVEYKCWAADANTRGTLVRNMRSLQREREREREKKQLISMTSGQT